jgi:hypothetical protein
MSSYVIRIEGDIDEDVVYVAYDMYLTGDTYQLRNARRFDSIVDVRSFIKQADASCLMVTLPKLMLWEDMTDQERMLKALSDAGKYLDDAAATMNAAIENVEEIERFVELTVDMIKTGNTEKEISLGKS